MTTWQIRYLNWTGQNRQHPVLFLTKLPCGLCHPMLDKFTFWLAFLTTGGGRSHVSSRIHEQKCSLALKWCKEHGGHERFFFIPWTTKLHLLLLIFNEMFPNVLHVVPRHCMDVQVKNCSNELYRFYATVIFSILCAMFPPHRKWFVPIYV